MESGSNREASKVASGDEGVVSSPGQEAAAVAAAGEMSVSPPAPAAATSSPKPYYECVFCKRGFTTAQALGGHMNIHRRDRVKTARELPAGAITTVSRNVDCYSKYRHLVMNPSMPMPIIGSSSNFGMYYPGTGVALAAAVETEGAISPISVSPRELILFGAGTRDHDLLLGLACHRDADDELRVPPEGSERQVGEPERELDLELRLGRRPRQ